MMQSWYGQSWGFTPGTVIGLGLLAAIIGIIVIVLKGYALWHAARRDEKVWFIVLLVVNTVGILELVYLFFVVGKWHKFSEPKAPIGTSTPGGTTA
jgi:hypothetical protein